MRISYPHTCQHLQMRGLARCSRFLTMGWLRAELTVALLLLSLCVPAGVCRAQDLAPRAYVITPLHSNAVTLTYSFYDGRILFDGSVPITDSTARVNIALLSIFHSFNFFGRTANFSASLPYGVGTFHGKVVGAQTLAYRSGLFPAAFRVSVNLLGGPAMNLQEYAKWRQKYILGVSLRVLPPTGQYDPTKLINYGTNRWAVKPELGYSQRWRHWIVDAYGGVWFFTTNREFFSQTALSPGTNTQSQNPTGSFEGHLSYDVKPRFWISLDGNFWFGGSTSVNGVQNSASAQRNSRVGATASFPITRHQSVKVSYSNGAYIQYGGDYRNVSLAWQYSWLGRPN